MNVSENGGKLMRSQYRLLLLVTALLGGCAAPAASSAAPVSSVDEKTPAPSVKAEVTVFPELESTNSWDSQDLHYTQYAITMDNQDARDITDWKFALEGPDDIRIDQSWNGSFDALTITPVDYNKTIRAGESLKDVGFIAKSSSKEQIRLVSTEVVFSDGQSITIAGQPEKQAETPAPSTTPKVTAAAPVGKLHVQGTRLCNEQGQPVQLRGVSTHGLAWFPQFVNEEAFRTLRDDWHANTIRLAMYTAESGGYCTDGDQNHLKQLIDNGVRAAADLGMYVIIDWHILSDSSPAMHQTEALAFFEEMSRKYAGYDNVLYEICNEPQNSPFVSVIRPYAQAVLQVIRANDPDAVVLCGTNTWSQDVDEVIGNRLEDPNVMYTLHFYAGTHKDNIRSKLQKALDAGIPVFVSECSICDASGNGGIDYDSANAWLNLLNENQVSYMAWSLSNKNETSALIRADCSLTSGWKEADLSETGQWFRKAMRQA